MFVIRLFRPVVVTAECHKVIEHMERSSANKVCGVKGLGWQLASIGAFQCLSERSHGNLAGLHTISHYTLSCLLLQLSTNKHRICAIRLTSNIKISKGTPNHSGAMYRWPHTELWGDICRPSSSPDQKVNVVDTDYNSFYFTLCSMKREQILCLKRFCNMLDQGCNFSRYRGPQMQPIKLPKGRT